MMQWIPYATLLVLVMLILVAAGLLVYRMEKIFQSQIQDRDLTIQNLLNRIQAQDLGSYNRLQDASKITEGHPVSYHSQSDEAELNRIKQMTDLGEEVHDDVGDGPFIEAFGFAPPKPD